ncbi:TIP41-domain-containing protein [Lipomyces japonicus]|uniref:TIP41-domain-containing protein n=1 Tax=Lipomyces japonicus TaxID=56871 RepID=UPI0034CEDE14
METGSLFSTHHLAKPAVSRHGWSVYSSKRAILKAEEIDQIGEQLKIPIPEMIFGNNVVKIENHELGWSIDFNAIDALDRVDKYGNPDGGLVKVAYSDAWLKDKQQSENGVHKIVKPFDWTYTTDYKGTLSPSVAQFAPTDDRIPLEKLTLPDPILFFDDVHLFEDELGDNGVAMLSVKVRVMPERLLLLSRFFLRVDDVVFRIRDTRIFIEFSKHEVIREYVAKQDSYENVRRRISPSARDFGLYLRDPAWLTTVLPVVQTTVEKATLS